MCLKGKETYLLSEAEREGERETVYVQQQSERQRHVEQHVDESRRKMSLRLVKNTQIQNWLSVWSLPPLPPEVSADDGLLMLNSGRENGGCDGDNT